MPDALLSFACRQDRQRGHCPSLLTLIAYPHLSTPGSRHQRNCRSIQALLAEMPRDGLGDGRGGAGPDLRNMERDREAITGCLGTRRLTRYTYHVQMYHVSSSCGSVTIISTTPHAGPVSDMVSGTKRHAPAV